MDGIVRENSYQTCPVEIHCIHTHRCIGEVWLRTGEQKEQNMELLLVILYYFVCFEIELKIIEVTRKITNVKMEGFDAGNISANCH